MPKFIHLRSTQGNGAVTIAYTVLSEVGHHEIARTRVFYALAKCSPRDNFCRRTGRVKSAGRLNSPRYVKDYIFTSYDDMKSHFLKYHPDHVEAPKVEDRPIGRSAAEAPSTWPTLLDSMGCV